MDLFRLLMDPYGHNNQRSSAPARGRTSGRIGDATRGGESQAPYPFPFRPGATRGTGNQTQAQRRSGPSLGQQMAANPRTPVAGDVRSFAPLPRTREPQIEGVDVPAEPFPFPSAPPPGTRPNPDWAAVDPVDLAARTTGTPANYLQRLIGHESSGDPTAKASTSTATGHAQFIEQTWLEMVHRYGERYGAGDLAAQIRLERGRYKTPNNTVLQQVLDLRTNPRWAALMAGHYAQENAAALAGRLNRRVTEGEVYLAHFAGPDKAALLIQAAARGTQGRQETGASIVGEEAARSNGHVFYEGGRYDQRGYYLGGGRARTAAEVVRLQTRNFRSASWPQRASGNQR